jgi:hypothetical protein
MRACLVLEGGIMSNASLLSLIAAALLCFALPAWGQELPEGRGTIPGGGNIVRNTSVTREGDFVLANSLVNAVTLVKISK